MRKIALFLPVILFILTQILINTNVIAVKNNEYSLGWQGAVTVSAIVVIWFLLPNRKKSPKMSKKVVDKKTIVR